MDRTNRVVPFRSLRDVYGVGAGSMAWPSKWEPPRGARFSFGSSKRPRRHLWRSDAHKYLATTGFLNAIDAATVAKVTRLNHDKQPRSLWDLHKCVCAQIRWLLPLLIVAIAKAIG
jgi:hypothetical protein